MPHPRPPRLPGLLPGLGLPELPPHRRPESLPGLGLPAFPVLAQLPRSQEERPSIPRSSIQVLASFFLLLFSPNFCELSIFIAAAAPPGAIHRPQRANPLGSNRQRALR